MAYFTRGSWGVPVYHPGQPKLPANFGDWIASLDAQNAPPPEPNYDYPPVDYGPPPEEAQLPPAPPPYDPNQDPAYQALLAQLGLAETGYRADAAKAQADARTQAAIQLPRIGEQGVESRRNIGLGYEGRGMFRSGARLRDLAIQRRGEGQRLGDLQNALATRVAGINTTLDQQLRDLAMRRATSTLQASMAAAGL